MTAQSDKVMTIPIDANAGVGEPLVTAIQRDVVVHLALVVFSVLLGTGHSGFLVSCEKKDQVAPGLDLGGIKRANRSQERFDVAGVVAHARRIHTTVANSSFDL